MIGCDCKYLFLEHHSARFVEIDMVDGSTGRNHWQVPDQFRDFGVGQTRASNYFFSIKRITQIKNGFLISYENFNSIIIV